MSARYSLRHNVLAKYILNDIIKKSFHIYYESREPEYVKKIYDIEFW